MTGFGTTRTRAPQNGAASFEEPFAPFGTTGPDLDTLSDVELEELLFQDDAAPKSGFWNLPTLTGLSLVGVGVAYLLQQFDLWNGMDLTALVQMLPVLSGILIILVGMGVLSWRPRNRRRKKAKRRVAEALSDLAGSAEKTSNAESSADGKTANRKAADRKKKRLRKSKHNKKLMGVCGGLAEYLNLDPTLVRIAFIIGMVVTDGAFLLGYFALAYVLPGPKTLSEEERLRIIRES